MATDSSNTNCWRSCDGRSVTCRNGDKKSENAPFFANFFDWTFRLMYSDASSSLKVISMRIFKADDIAGQRNEGMSLVALLSSWN